MEEAGAGAGGGIWEISALLFNFTVNLDLLSKVKSVFLKVNYMKISHKQTELETNKENKMQSI